MSVKFKCRATGDLLMLQAPAEALLRVLGKADSLTQGILEVHDMPAALAVLRALKDEVPEPASDEVVPDEPCSEASAADPISLRKRAWPFIQMIERAQAADKPIVWGVMG